MEENNLTNNEMQQRGRWYVLRFVFVMFCVLVATVLPTGCERNTPTGENNKPNIEVTDTTTIQKYNVELEFWNGTLDGVHGAAKLYPDTIQKYIDNEYVDTVYLVLHKGSTFGGTSRSTITEYRNGLENLTNISTRVRGRGDFYFQAGRCLPADSLYFVSKGWTVNQNQR